MTAKNTIKTEGLSFGRSLLVALKSASMYSVDHPVSEKGLQQTFTTLNALVMQAQRFTIGFMNQRLLLNSLLSDDKSLVQLETEFEKRGIAAISFAAGITFHEFKKALALLATKPQVIQEQGGIGSVLKRNPIQGLKVIPARSAKEGDTELGSEIESYLSAQGILGPQDRAGKDGLDLLLQLAGLDRPSGFANTAGETYELANEATLTALKDAETDPREPVKALARLLQELSPDLLLSILARGNQMGLREYPAPEMAAQMVEDTAAGWAAETLASSPPGPGAIAVEEEVVRVLSRGLKATQAVARILRKLEKLMAEAQLPLEIFERIRQELAWSALSEAEQSTQLGKLEQFDAVNFRRLIGYVKEMMRQGKIKEAVEVSKHYFARLEVAPVGEKAEGLGRAPELLAAVAAQQTFEFLREVARWLSREVQAAGPSAAECHRPVVACLLSLAHTAALYEEFELIHKTATDLHFSLAKGKTLHADCCGQALANLVSPRTAERLVELYLEKRDDPAWARTVTSLLKSAGRTGCEKVFERLTVEPAASNRMRLLRFFTQLGPSGTVVVRNALRDPRWYVVRNACYLAGDVNDPEMLCELSGALRHPDVRVQHAAVTALLKSRLPARARAFAEALPFLKERALEMTLEEIAYLKDPGSVDALEQFIFKGALRPDVLERTVRALTAIPSESAVEVLGRILSDTSQPLGVRKLALSTLARSPFALAQRFLSDFSTSAPDDPLAAECRAPPSEPVS